MACLQFALWFYRAFALGEEALFSTLLLTMFLWYHCLNAVFGGANVRLERMARAWARGWFLLVSGCAVFPLVFQCEGYPLGETLRTLLFALPCLVLYSMPVAESGTELASPERPAASW